MKDFGNKYFVDTSFYVYVFVGATSKDGSLAGIMIMMSLLLFVMNKLVKFNLVMMGEFMFIGRVLLIGGVKEKMIVARRSGVKIIIFFEGNKKDYDEFFEDICEGLDVYFVLMYDEVYC